MHKPLLSWTDPNGAHRLMVLIVSVFGLVSTIFGGHLRVANGFGWDGVTYGAMTRSLDSMIANGELSHYYAQRILAPGLVRLGLLASGLGVGDPQIIAGYEAYNLALVIGVALLWWRLANTLALTVRARWIGFAGLFLTFECSKLLFFAPVMTDSTALFLGMALVTAYVEKRPILLLLATIAGAFSWPVAGYYGAILLLFLGADLPKHVVEPEPLNLKTAGRVWLVSIGVAAATLPLIQLAWNRSDDRWWRWPQGAMTALPSWIGFAISLAVLAGSLQFFREALSSLLRPRLGTLLAIVAMVLPAVILRALSNPALKDANSILIMVWFTIRPPANMLLLPIVTSVSFWGPVALLLVLWWREVAEEARRLGAGFVGVTALTLFLALPTEPRFITCGWPFLVVLAARASERIPASRRFDIGFGVLALLLSHFWLPLDVGESSGSEEDLRVYPLQMLFMHLGFWMGWPAYLGYSAMTALGLLWLRRGAPSETEPSAGAAPTRSSPDPQP